MSKPRIVKDYVKLDFDIQNQLKLNYPYGFDKHLITFVNVQGKIVSALPYETDDRYYLIRMTKDEAQEIIEEDNDYDNDGNLKEESKEKMEQEHENNLLEAEQIPDS
jgi:hypothetical protein